MIVATYLPEIARRGDRGDVEPIAPTGPIVDVNRTVARGRLVSVLPYGLGAICYWDIPDPPLDPRPALWRKGPIEP